ncbi:MAG: hypothetical protein U0103_24305 [Candidatus Obscuribacterales bacterium]
MHGLGLLFSGVVVVAGVGFLFACPVFIPYLIGLAAIGWAFSFIRKRLPPELAGWFNTTLIVLGSLAGAVLVVFGVGYTSEVVWWSNLGLALAVGLVLSLMSWYFDWPNVDGGSVIGGSFLGFGALASVITMVGYFEFSIEHPPALDVLIDQLFGKAAVLGAIFGFGSCFLQRIFGINPKNDWI